MNSRSKCTTNCLTKDFVRYLVVETLSWAMIDCLTTEASVSGISVQKSKPWGSNALTIDVRVQRWCSYLACHLRNNRTDRTLMTNVRTWRPQSPCFRIVTIHLSQNFDFFIQNLIRFSLRENSTFEHHHF